MKIINTFLLGLSLLSARTVFAQDNLPAVYLPADLTLHFISPEPIQYVDISSKLLTGDLPLKNVLRIRLRDSAASFKDAVVTIAGEKFIAQYHILPGTGRETEIDIMPGDTRPLDISGIGFSQNQLKAMSLSLAAMKPDKKLEKKERIWHYRETEPCVHGW